MRIVLSLFFLMNINQDIEGKFKTSRSFLMSAPDKLSPGILPGNKHDHFLNHADATRITQTQQKCFSNKIIHTNRSFMISDLFL